MVVNGVDRMISEGCWLVRWVGTDIDVSENWIMR